MGLPQPESTATAEGGRSGSDWLRWLLLVAQVGLVALAVYRFQIGSRAFSTISILALGGYVVHFLLPGRLRMPFFALLSLAGTVVILGPASGAWLIALGFALIGLAHLKLPGNALAWLMFAVCLVLMAGRAELYEVPWSGTVWPVLGGMFMFRMVVFLYDRKHGEKGGSLWETISYFFLLPNVCFPLFPCVDYKTFRRSGKTEAELNCHQTGVRWMIRGVLQLLLYRFLYYYGVVSPDEVSTPVELVRYLVTNIALYLRVSGTFHVVIGMLRLFGFALPETHFMYFASASINDFWRRANIYWKDFMLKVFYFPTYFKLRKKGDMRALIQSTLVVVAATWVLHSYQWFWIRNSFPVKWQDGYFWCALGVLMIVNTIQENRSKGARGRRARKWTLANAFGQGWRIALTFTFLCVSWAIWSCESWDAFWRMMTLQGDGVEDTQLAHASVVLPVLAVVNVLEAWSGKLIRKKGEERPMPSAFLGLGSAGLLVLVSVPSVYHSLGTTFSDTVQDLRVVKLNRIDITSLERGYYEDLLDVDRFNEELQRVYEEKPASWLELHETPAMQPVDGFLLFELKPDVAIPYKGATLRVNSFGLRDEEYAVEKPENTTRIALLGASYIMGSGVENEETFDSVLEDALNASGPDAPTRAYEVLNLGVGGYSPMQRVQSFEEKALAFDPDVALYVAHENEAHRIVRHFVGARKRGIAPPDGLAKVLRDHGVDGTEPDDRYQHEIELIVPEILKWTWDEYARSARENGVRPVWVFLPTLEVLVSADELAWMRDLARDAGCDIVDLYGVFDGLDTFSLKIANWDYHPNAEGHRIIGEGLFDELVARPELLAPDDGGDDE